MKIMYMGTPLFAARVLEIIREEFPDSDIDVTFTCFRPDPRKAGGRYVSITGKIREIEPALRVVTLTDATRISFDDIYKIESARFDEEAFE